MSADVFPAVEIINIVLIIEQRQSIMELCRYSIKQIDRFMIDLHSFAMNSGVAINLAGVERIEALQRLAHPKLFRA